MCLFKKLARLQAGTSAVGSDARGVETWATTACGDAVGVK